LGIADLTDRDRILATLSDAECELWHYLFGEFPPVGRLQLDRVREIIEATKRERNHMSDAERKTLKWFDSDGEIEAYNTAGLKHPAGGLACWYILDQENGRWDVDCSEFPTVPRELDGFGTLEEAKAWCEREDKLLWANTRKGTR
jgi:hypothetical protein